jgi:hypothetical protein
VSVIPAILVRIHIAARIVPPCDSCYN